jgi:tetratricopeptide (TPR) repeat protein
VWNNLALALREVRRFEEAISALEHAGEICREVGDRYAQAETLENLGVVQAEVGQPEQARGAWVQAIELFMAAGADEDAARVRQRLDRDG